MITKAEKDMWKKRHEKNMKNPAYLEGFASKSDKNPYEMPESLWLKIVRIGSKEGALTDQEKLDLGRMNAEFQATPLDMWSNGHHNRMTFKQNGKMKEIA